MTKLREFYDKKYENEVWKPITLLPDRMHTNGYDDMYRLLSSKLNKGKVLEIGCGSGRLAISFAEKGYSVTGFDLSEKRIEIAKNILNKKYAYLKENVEFCTGDIDDPLPGNKNSYDACILCAVIEHIPNFFVTLRQCHELLKNSGYIIISVPNLQYIKHIISIIIGRVPITGTKNRNMEYWEEHGWDGAHFHYFTKKELYNALLHIGFQPLSCTSSGKYSKFRRWSRLFSGDLNVIAKKIN